MESGGATWGIQRFTGDRPCQAEGTAGAGLEPVERCLQLDTPNTEVTQSSVQHHITFRAI